MPIWYLIISGLFSMLSCGSGVLIAFVFVIATTGAGPDASDDRNALLEILSEFEIDDKKALAILERGLGPWAQWRRKTRPLLWWRGLDWPEYGETYKEEFMMHYGADLPEESDLEAELDSYSPPGQDDSQISSEEAEEKSGTT